MRETEVAPEGELVVVVAALRGRDARMHESALAEGVVEGEVGGLVIEEETLELSCFERISWRHVDCGGMNTVGMRIGFSQAQLSRMDR